MVILETDSGTAKSFIKKWQQAFLKKLSPHDEFEQSPIGKAIDLAICSKCEIDLYVEKLEKLHPIQEDLHYICKNVLL